MKKGITLFCAVLVLLTSCGTNASYLPTTTTVDVSALKTFVVETVMADAAKTATANIPTETLPPTQTLTPASTPTVTLTPTITFTPTNSPTPIPLTSFVPLTFVDGLRSSPNEYVGRFIKALTNISDDPTYKYWLAPSDYSPRGVYVKLINDTNADDSVVRLKNHQWVWIYGVVKKTNDEFPLLSVTHVETIPDDQLPRGDGVYRVNTDVAPGRWKSMSDATETQSCYWARIASDGSIIDNFFGYGGTTLYVSKSDFAVEFKDCSVMVYLGK